MTTDDAKAEAGQILDEAGIPALPVFPDPSNPMAVARQFAARYAHEGRSTLLRWCDQWMTWNGHRWVEGEHKLIRADLYKCLEHAWYEAGGGDDDEKKMHKWRPNRKSVGNVLEALEAVSQIPGAVTPPAWLIDDPPVPAGPLVTCTNGLMHAGERKLYGPLTPDYFTLVSVPFAYDEQAPEPERWLEFLGQLWPGDDDSIVLLQDWFGYVLSGRTDLHKIVALIGPSRSGKGTIARVITALLGRNVIGPTLASLGSQFGLMPLMGKPLAVISDARLGRANEHVVVERLLSLSGEDMLTVDRKYKEPWTGTLPTRIMILSNEVPRFTDSSAAIADRFVILRMTQSWLGRENTRLTGSLLEELPGILNWALDGLARLDQRGRFAEPGSSADAKATLRDVVSPISVFLQDCAVTRCRHAVPCRHEVVVDHLYRRYQEWCEDNRQHAGSKTTWAKDLLAAVPALHRVRAGREWQPSPGSVLTGVEAAFVKRAKRPYLYTGIRLRLDDWPDDPEDDPEEEPVADPRERCPAPAQR
jgi:putative DNA primase/helicase